MTPKSCILLTLNGLQKKAPRYFTGGALQRQVFSYDVLKILGDGELTKNLRVCAHRFSQSAKEKIEKAGGEVVILPGKKPVVKKPRKESAGTSA